MVWGCLGHMTHVWEWLRKVGWWYGTGMGLYSPNFGQWEVNGNKAVF